MIGELMSGGLVLALLALGFAAVSGVRRLEAIEAQLARLEALIGRGQAGSDGTERLDRFLDGVDEGVYPGLRRDDAESRELAEIRARYAGRDGKLYGNTE